MRHIQAARANGTACPTVRPCGFRQELEQGVQSMNNRSPMIAGGFAALNLLVATPPEAEANFKRQHASSCIEDSFVSLAYFLYQFLSHTSSTFFAFFYSCI